MTGPRRARIERGIVHIGPDDGVCSVNIVGCGYCHGPCKLPVTAERPPITYNPEAPQ